MQNRRRIAALAVIALSAVGAPAAIAWQLGSRPAEAWIERLSRPERVQQLRIDEVISRLGLKPGDVLADIGAGSGVFSLPFAGAVAPGGKVYSVEVDQGLVDHIAELAQEAGVENVSAVLGEFTDPKIPAQNIDLAFFHDVLHHIEDRPSYLNTLARYIAPDGRIAVIERGHGQSGGGHMHVSKEQATAWMADAGFRLSEEHFLYDGGKWFLIYTRK